MRFVVERHGHQHRAEDFFLAHLLAVVQTFEDGRRVVVTLVVNAAARALATEQQTSAFGQPQRHIAFHRLAVTGADQRAHLRTLIRRITDTQLGCRRHQARHERLIQCAGDEQPRTGDAGFARRTEDAVQHTGHRMVEVGVIEDDGRRFAAQFQ
ncbi:hypothetical protein D3C72_955030 [compost metagenome]